MALGEVREADRLDAKGPNLAAEQEAVDLIALGAGSRTEGWVHGDIGTSPIAAE